MRVLILCTGNSARSQMAEAILRHLSHGRIEVESAGTSPQPDIHPMARIAVSTLLGLEMTGQHPKQIDGLLPKQFDYVITVCDHAAEACPVFPGHSQRLHWGLADPASARGTGEEKQRAFDDTARQLVTRIRLWLSLPNIRAAL